MNHHPHISDCTGHIYIRPSLFYILFNCMAYLTISFMYPGQLSCFVFTFPPSFINYMWIGNNKQILLISVYSMSSTPPSPLLSAVVESSVTRGANREPDADLAPRPSMYIVDTVLDVAVG